MVHYILNFDGVLGSAGAPPGHAAGECLRSGICVVPQSEKHAKGLATGDLVLIYVGNPVREFVGRAVVAAPARALTPAPGEHPVQPSYEVVLTDVEQWDPPVTMADVLRRIGPSEKAKADIPSGVVGITEREYLAAVSAAFPQDSLGVQPS